MKNTLVSYARDKNTLYNSKKRDNVSVGETMRGARGSPMESKKGGKGDQLIPVTY